MYHPKPFPKDKKVEAVKKASQHLGFMFPVALDNDWTTLKKFWLNRADRSYTSVSFLIDKKGVIRHIHPGGEYHEDGKGSHEQCRIDYLEMKDMIEKLIEETYAVEN
jgi:peroxiredoxin